jgi:hypothetical protein
MNRARVTLLERFKVWSVAAAHEKNPEAGNI